MSVEALAAALQVQGITPIEKLVLLGIANHAGDGGSWPSQSTLAIYALCSTRTVRRALAVLSERGFITIEVNQGGNTVTRADRRPNLYHLHLDGWTPYARRDRVRVDTTGARVDMGGHIGWTPGCPPNRPITIHKKWFSDPNCAQCPGDGWVNHANEGDVGQLGPCECRRSEAYAAP